MNELTYDYTIDWGDGNTENINATKPILHYYRTPGVYTVSISGNFPAIRMATQSSASKLLSIEQWGEIEWESFVGAFQGCTNLEYNAKDAPNLSKVTDITSIFQDCTRFNADLNNWDVSSIEEMQYAFAVQHFLMVI